MTVNDVLIRYISQFTGRGAQQAVQADRQVRRELQATTAAERQLATTSKQTASDVVASTVRERRAAQEAAAEYQRLARTAKRGSDERRAAAHLAAQEEQRAARTAGDSARANRGIVRSLVGIGAGYVGVRSLIRGFTELSNEAIDADTTLRQVERTVERVQRGAWARYGDQIQRVLNRTRELTGFDDEDLARVFMQQVRSTNDVAEALRNVGLASDVARARGMGLAQASMLVLRASQGNVGQLRRQGIVIQQVTDEQDRLRRIHGGVTAAMRAEAKERDRLATGQRALAQLQRVFGREAREWGESSAGGLARANAAIDEAQESIGTVLLPSIGRAAQATARWVNEWVRSGRAQQQAEAVLDGIRGVLAVVVPLLQGGATAVNRIAGAMGGWENAAKFLLAGYLARHVYGFVRGVQAARAEMALLGAQSASTGLTTIAADALTAGTRVRALTTLLRGLTAFGLITIGIEVIINRKEVGRALLGGDRPEDRSTGQRIARAIDERVPGLAWLDQHLLGVTPDRDIRQQRARDAARYRAHAAREANQAYRRMRLQERDIGQHIGRGAGAMAADPDLYESQVSLLELRQRARSRVQAILNGVERFGTQAQQAMQRATLAMRAEGIDPDSAAGQQRQAAATTQLVGSLRAMRRRLQRAMAAARAAHLPGLVQQVADQMSALDLEIREAVVGRVEAARAAAQAAIQEAVQGLVGRGERAATRGQQLADRILARIRGRGLAEDDPRTFAAQQEAGSAVLQGLRAQQGALRQALGRARGLRGQERTQAVQQIQGQLDAIGVDIANQVADMAASAREAVRARRQRRLDALRLNVERSEHRSQLAQAALQNLEVRQQLRGLNLEDPGVQQQLFQERAQLIRRTVLPRLRADLRNLRRERAAELRAHDFEAARATEQAIAQKQLEISQATLDATQQVAQNTRRTVERLTGTLGFDLNNQLFTDVVGAGVGV